jgi:hypothetical protein
MALIWNDVSELLELLFSISSEVFITYNNYSETIETDYHFLEDIYSAYLPDIKEINWEYENTDIIIKPIYRTIRINTPDLELVRLIRMTVIGKGYESLEISLSVP